MQIRQPIQKSFINGSNIATMASSLALFTIREVGQKKLEMWVYNRSNLHAI
jgi:hypothetical protein